MRKWRTSAELAATQAKLAAANKNSANSSKPPSSDIVKPPRRPSKKKRKQGGQPGHPRHERPPFEAEQIDDTIDYALSSCPDCGGRVEPSTAPPRVVQQVELVVKPIEVVAHRGLAYWCARCQKTHYAAIDANVRRAGLIGPGLTTLIAYLKGACHCSFSTIRKFVRDVVGLTISRGHLAKLIAKASDSLQFAYDLLLKMLPQQSVVNADETGHKDNGDGMWTWCFRAPLFTLFKISPSRGSEVLLDVLGKEFDGVLGCDYFSAYRGGVASDAALGPGSERNQAACRRQGRYTGPAHAGGDPRPGCIQHHRAAIPNGTTGGRRYPAGCRTSPRRPARGGLLPHARLHLGRAKPADLFRIDSGCHHSPTPLRRQVGVVRWSHRLPKASPRWR